MDVLQLNRPAATGCHKACGGSTERIHPFTFTTGLSLTQLFATKWLQIPLEAQSSPGSAFRVSLSALPSTCRGFIGAALACTNRPCSSISSQVKLNHVQLNCLSQLYSWHPSFPKASPLLVVIILSRRPGRGWHSCDSCWPGQAAAGAGALGRGNVVPCAAAREGTGHCCLPLVLPKSFSLSYQH